MFCKDPLKYSLFRALEAHIPDTIKKQEKNILICEIVRMLMDEGQKLGYCLCPPPKTDTERYAQKSHLTESLWDVYARYKGTHASVKNVTSDLIDEAAKIGVTVVPL